MHLRVNKYLDVFGVFFLYLPMFSGLIYQNKYESGKKYLTMDKKKREKMPGTVLYFRGD